MIEERKAPNRHEHYRYSHRMGNVSFQARERTWVYLTLQEDLPDLEDPLEKELGTRSSILTWRIPWTEEPGRLESIELQRVRHH